MLLWTLLTSPSAWAEEPPAPVNPADQARAKELYENGAELYAEGLYAEAILAWQEGYALSQLPDFLFNIAGAQERLGDWKGALDTLSRYRAFATAEERETLARRIRNLEERLAADDKKPPPQPAPAPNPSPDPQPAVVQRQRSLKPVIGGTLLGLGGVGLVVGVASGLGSAGAGADAQGLCVEQGTGFLCPATADEALHKEKTSALVADLGFGLGSALALGGVVVFVLPSKDAGTARLTIAPDAVAVTFVR